MKQELHHSSGKGLKGLFCLGLSAVLAATVALSGTAANRAPVQYDIKVASSPTHTSALSDGKLYFWGTNEKGQLPGADVSYSPEPLQLLSGVRDVAVSDSRTLVVFREGELRTYGLDPSSQKTSPAKGTKLASDAAQVCASDSFAAYVSKAGALYTWGANQAGQLGVGGTEPSDKPVQVFESGVEKVALGNSFALALMDNGDVYGWGNNSSFQIGYAEDGADSPQMVETPVKIAEQASDITAGSSHACVLKTDGTLWTCGDNTYSQTGAGSELAYHGLTQVMSGIRSISTGSLHNFAVSTDGTVYAWGYGLSGQLGSGTNERMDTPTATEFDFVQTFASGENTFGISPDGSVYSFGNNTNYLLGKTDGSNSLSPMRILDVNMNWVYEESLNANDNHNHGADAPDANGGETQTPDPTPVEPEEVKDPEIVSTPFISGDGKGSFKPEDNITRAEFLRMVVSALCKDFDPDVDYGSSSFSDVKVGSWYEKFVAYAEANPDPDHLLNGRGDGTCGPNDNITRAEASSLVVRALNLSGTSAPDAGFKDVPADHWAKEAIDILVADGTLHGDGSGHFNPNDNLTRAEAATIVAQATSFRPEDSEKTELVAGFPTSPFKDVSTDVWYYVYVLRAVGYVK